MSGERKVEKHLQKDLAKIKAKILHTETLEAIPGRYAGLKAEIRELKEKAKLKAQTLARYQSQGTARYVRCLWQAGPVEEDQEERRAKYLAWLQNHGVHLQLGPLLIRAVSWPFMVMKFSKLCQEYSHTDYVEAFAKTFDIPLEDAREAVAVFMGEAEAN